MNLALFLYMREQSRDCWLCTQCAPKKIAKQAVKSVVGCVSVREVVAPWGKTAE